MSKRVVCPTKRKKRLSHCEKKTDGNGGTREKAKEGDK